MKLYPVFKTFAIFLFGLITTACINNEEQETPKDHDLNLEAWKNFENFKFEVFNAKKTNNEWIVVGREGFYIQKDLETKGQEISFGNRLTRKGRYKIPISENFLASRSEVEIFLIPITTPLGDADLIISPKQMDSQFAALEDIPIWQSKVMGINDEGSILFSYRTSEQNIAHNNPRFLLVKPTYQNGKIEIKDVKIIKHEFITWFDNNYSIESIGKFFHVQISSATFKIDNQGVVTHFIDFPSRSVLKENNLITFGFNNREGKLIVYSTNPGNQSPSVIGQKEEASKYLNAEFEMLNNRIIGFKNDLLFEVKLGNGIEIIDLDNSNLKGNTITSISLFDENQVLITSLCRNDQNNCGIFVTTLENLK